MINRAGCGQPRPARQVTLLRPALFRCPGEGRDPPFGASILEEALFQHTEADDHGLRNGKILGNDTARIEPVVRGATYGRRITMDYPNGQGRNLTTFYFRDGKLYEMSVQILPANGDYGTPTASRFVESLIFNLERQKETAEGLPPNIQGCGTTIQPFKS